MPRTTRSRVASSRQQGVSSSSSDPALVNTEQQTHPIPSDETDIYGVSDRELERQRKGKEANTTTSTTTDNTVNETSTSERGGRRSTRSRISTTDAVALQASRRRRDAALDRLDDLTSTTTTTTTTTTTDDAVETGRRDNYVGSSDMDSSLLGPASRGHGNLSGMEIHDDEIFGNLDSSFASADDKDGTASHSGTRSADTSTFNVSVFKRQQPRAATRRRRRSSIVGKDDAPIRPSSRGPTTPGLSSTFSLGNFKRRQRQPSILMSSAQKSGLGLVRGGSRAASEENENENAVESEPEEEEESFLPEAEGTPVRLSRGRRSATDEVVDLETEPEERGRETRSRKRRSDQGHDSEAAKRQAVEAEEDTIHPSIEMGSSPPSFVARRRVTPELDEAILAPPASDSSSAGSPTAWPSLKNLGKKHHKGPSSRAHKATPALDDDMSDISEPPSLTHSPNFKATKPAAMDKRQDSPKLSTADLEALLPRRRRKVRRDEYDLDGRDSGSEQEEVQRPSRAAKKNKKPVPKPLKGSSNKTNQTNTAGAAAPAKKRTTRRTYGSRSFDKENTTEEGESIEVSGEADTPLDDTAFEEAEKTADLPAELRAASRKFKEVDQWELDFEEVVEPSSDLPEGR